MEIRYRGQKVDWEEIAERPQRAETEAAHKVVIPYGGTPPAASHPCYDRMPEQSLAKHQIRGAEQGGSSHLAVGPNGEIAVRIAPKSASGHKFHQGVDLIAISLDGGKSWQKRTAPGEREWVKEART